ncbi:BTAD domain-containing putative transcriptional regulator [Streptomyces sp. WAC04114]|uniref:BTAD domain-containing putative transcriptional regulator n=1 Tax=Streptomyces sp. WAC04114 TaxID=2867961 RepID=UPI001C8B3934|nr:BTAD domain-containing putative transcriptional regulator [Streptomyces sp. WAC04114]MBX9362409.1 winged helix-turn-helix domain-containing protein [Streptomyces sp. WAC04114]
MHYRILGTTQALRSDGTVVSVGGARLRALLTVLALRAGRTVPAGLLVDEVWGGQPPADASGALQALVGRLRRALGADAVASVEGGYRLTAAPDDVDLHRFERLADEGLRALADGDPAKAVVVLDDALALWRGPALADLPDRTAEAARRDTRRLDVLRARHTAALALGQAEQSLPELTALCDGHPLDEPLHALRLRALRDAGRAAEALDAYEDVRRLLADRLGADPGPELRSLHAELLRLGDTPGPAPARSAGNLRARLTSFIGRETDIETIRGDLAAARLVTLLGPGGAGKTRLSQEAAEAVRATMPGGVWLAELAPVDDPDAVPEAVLTAVGARETVLYGAGAEGIRAAVADRLDDPVERLAEHCSRPRMLLILDNCEHVADAAARLTEELLARCPDLTVLATSREPLGVPGELLRPVEPLPEPVALRLLADRGAAARPGFRIEDDPGACAEICRRLDGLPLAIELAAARLRVLTPRQIADRLDDRFRLLTSGSRTVLPRQQTLRAVVDWSWELLDKDERDVLRRLSVFAGGCDLPAAEAVCGPAALEALGSLVDRSLVVAAPPDGSAGGEMRYRLLETVAEYAGERLDESGQRADAERAHLTYFRELARLTDPLLRGPGQLAAIHRLEREYENLRTALRHAVALRDEQEALCLALSLVWYWQMRDLRIEARNWCREVMTLGPDPFAEPVRPAVAVWERCTDAPPPMTGEVLAEARRGIHLAHLACMDTELDAWQNPRSQEKLRAIARTYEPGLPQNCRLPGLLWFFAVMLTGDMDRLRVIIDASIRTCRQTPGFDWELASGLQMRANFLANRTDWAGDAARDADESLEIYRRIGDAWGTAEALSARAEAHERRGDYALAAADYEAAIGHAEHLGARAQAAVLSARLGSALLEAGEGERGERLLREVIAQHEESHSEAMPAARLFLAGRLGMTGRATEAREQLRRLRQDFRIAHFIVFDTFILATEAWLDAAEGRYEDCLERIRKGIERAADPLSEAIAPHMRSSYLVIGARALAALDGGRRAADAARCLGAFDTLLPPGHVAQSQERETREQAERHTRALLGDQVYEAAYAEGGGLSIEEATALL